MGWLLKCLIEKIEYAVSDEEKVLNECLSCGETPPNIEYTEE